MPEHVHEALPWTSLEELVAVHEPARLVQQGSPASLLAKVVLLVGFGSAIVPVIRSGLPSSRSSPDDKLPRYMV